MLNVDKFYQGNRLSLLGERLKLQFDHTDNIVSNNS